MRGGDVLADRGQCPQPVPLAEGQPQLPQHGRRGQPAAGSSAVRSWRATPSGSTPSRLSSRRPARVISGAVTEASTDTATLSSRRSPPIRASIPVRSARHRSATSPRSACPWAA